MIYLSPQNAVSGETTTDTTAPEMMPFTASNPTVEAIAENAA